MPSQNMGGYLKDTCLDIVPDLLRIMLDVARRRKVLFVLQLVD